MEKNALNGVESYSMVMEASVLRCRRMLSAGATEGMELTPYSLKIRIGMC